MYLENLVKELPFLSQNRIQAVTTWDMNNIVNVVTMQRQ